MPRKANSVSARKAKGRRLTQLVCARLLGLVEKLGLTAEDIRPVPSSVPGPDIWMSSAALRYFPFAFECKNQESVSIWAWWKQATQNSKPLQAPVLVFKRNNSDPLVLIDLELFTSLVSERIESKGCEPLRPSCESP